MKEYTTILQAEISSCDFEDARVFFEGHSINVWISKTTRCQRGNFLGVPARHLDVLIDDQLDEHDRVTFAIAKKRGKFDGSIRDRFMFRRRVAGMETVASRFEMKYSDELFVQVVTEGGDRLWSATYPVMRYTLDDRSDTRGILAVQRERYFKHLPHEVVDELAEAFKLELQRESIGTITRANRLAGRMLYRASVERGWRKLTLRQRQKWGLGEKGGPWVREEVLANGAGVGSYSKTFGMEDES